MQQRVVTFSSINVPVYVPVLDLDITRSNIPGRRLIGISKAPTKLYVSLPMWRRLQRQHWHLFVEIFHVADFNPLIRLDEAGIEDQFTEAERGLPHPEAQPALYIPAQRSGLIRP